MNTPELRGLGILVLRLGLGSEQSTDLAMRGGGEADALRLLIPTCNETQVPYQANLLRHP